MVGAGVLSLAYATAQLGWGPGVTIMILSWLVILYTLWQMVEPHEMIPDKRFDSSTSGISLVAAVMSLSYSTIAWRASVAKGVQPNVDYSYKASSTSGKVLIFLPDWEK
ncbi:hypothetical protein F3Y22_tig00110653pilonHSYRG00022 [Hibiscus syriacus]|uniref:Amino acid transporter transmembrane domain-containing protein n=1 Tax=Hibiscus syriacus TaxID=106335 RepID=A0A6A2ZZ37_HIBSY|nr:hypothetical protein F3Y22_tig00110653pilonHSYRG00022 [Hibiscus syriacus]